LVICPEDKGSTGGTSVAREKFIPGSSDKGSINTRSTDANGKQADEVKPHSEIASEQPAEENPPSGEAAGALRDQVGRGKG
jgi:hypothetical protein